MSNAAMTNDDCRLGSLVAFGLVFMLACSTTRSSADEARRHAASKEAASLRSTDPVVSFIDQQIRQGWADNDVVPSAAADDAEWFRRIHLDLVGHIPPWNEIDRFHRDKNPAKRAALVDKLIDSPGYVRNWTTIWTNLTIGRKTVRWVSRTGMERFFREAFAQNRPWNEVVHDLVAAEGRSDENGAVNYLLAQMTTNDEGVQATAKTTRLFMGIQVQCTQCHNHPFNEWKQDQFWQINSFLGRRGAVDHRKFDPASGTTGRRLRRVGPQQFFRTCFLRKTQRRNAGRLSDLLRFQGRSRVRNGPPQGIGAADDDRRESPHRPGDGQPDMGPFLGTTVSPARWTTWDRTSRRRIRSCWTACRRSSSRAATISSG